MKLAFLILLALLAQSAQAGELLVQGEVLRVEPITRAHTRHEQVGDCAPTKPAAGADLVSLLRWDLRADCRTQEITDQIVSGYRVHYRWDNRRWQTVMEEHPGESIALRVQIN